MPATMTKILILSVAVSVVFAAMTAIALTNQSADEPEPTTPVSEPDQTATTGPRPTPRNIMLKMWLLADDAFDEQDRRYTPTPDGPYQTRRATIIHGHQTRVMSTRVAWEELATAAAESTAVVPPTVPPSPRPTATPWWVTPTVKPTDEHERK